MSYSFGCKCFTLDYINMIKRWDCTVPFKPTCYSRLDCAKSTVQLFIDTSSLVCHNTHGDATGNGAQPIILREILAEFQVSRLSSRPQLMGLLAQRGRFPFGLPNSRLEGEICNGTPFLDCNMATKISTDFNIFQQRHVRNPSTLVFPGKGSGAETSTAISQARGISCRVHGSRW